MEFDLIQSEMGANFLCIERTQTGLTLKNERSHVPTISCASMHICIYVYSNIKKNRFVCNKSINVKITLQLCAMHNYNHYVVQPNSTKTEIIFFSRLSYWRSYSTEFERHLSLANSHRTRGIFSLEPLFYRVYSLGSCCSPQYYQG